MESDSLSFSRAWACSRDFLRASDSFFFSLSSSTCFWSMAASTAVQSVSVWLNSSSCRIWALAARVAILCKSSGSCLARLDRMQFFMDRNERPRALRSSEARVTSSTSSSDCSADRGGALAEGDSLLTRLLAFAASSFSFSLVMISVMPRQVGTCRSSNACNTSCSDAWFRTILQFSSVNGSFMFSLMYASRFTRHFCFCFNDAARLRLLEVRGSAICSCSGSPSKCWSPSASATCMSVP
mmetsp:Transcript_66218/g.110594  ORF Transcript_66218/g.110594 Transcript_66218/m.110594 type:complete len:240 (+) Transcript_66218:2841-3560(+)